MRLALGAVLLAVPVAASAQRTVESNRLASPALPAATIVVDRGMKYAGAQTFDLYGVATAEQHFFVELDGTRIKRLLWVQFEGYHSSNTHTYDYRDSTISHSGRSWHRRVAATRLPDQEPRPDSDGAKARAFLRSKGWMIGPELLTERLVWVLDASARNELMLIYLEDLGNEGLTASDLAPNGKAKEQWPTVADAFHRRALASFQLVDQR